MKNLCWFLILLALLVSASFAYSDVSTKRAKIEDIVKNWKLDEELQNYHESCVAGYNKGNPEILVKDNPDYFYGIKPGSPDWDSIITSWNKYVEASCGFINAKKYKETIIDTLSSQLTGENADEILRFYKKEWLGLSRCSECRLSENAKLLPRNSHCRC